MNNIISQDFWCATLSKENPECKWEHVSEEITHHLMVEQVVLGLNCKERCMVEATSKTVAGEEKSTMICQLIPNAVPNASLSLSFKQVTLKLAAGDGPVYLTGTHSQEIEGEDESDDEMMAPELVDGEAKEEESEEDDGEEESSEEEIDEDKMMEELAAAQANKLKNFISKKAEKKNSKPGPLSKKEEAPAPAKVEPAKVEEPAKEEAKKEEPKKEEAVKAEAKVEEVEMKEADDEESDDDEDDDEEDEDDDEEGDDDDDDDDEEVESDDDDDEEEEEDDDDDDDDEAESDEESEEEEVEPAAPVTKKRKVEPEAPVTPAAPAKNGKATPKPVKKTPAKPNLNELKKKLLASPSLPKKYEKFANLMKNAHKITDDKEIKTTWEFVQKNKK